MLQRCGSGLIPQMNAFDGVSAKSIVIMDNCSIHHVDEVKRMFRDAGIACVLPSTI
jgi:hypothetical protein